MTQQNKLMTALLLVVMAAMVSACSKNDTSGSTDDQASRSLDTGSGVYASCNQGTSSGGAMQANIESYVDSGTRRDDLMRLKFNSITSSFSSNTSYIQMWRWQVTSSGQTYLDTTPVSFRLESLSTGAALTNFVSSMRWSDISSVASSLGVSTPADLFARVRITADIRDPNAQYDVLKVVYYNASTNVAQDQLDLLMPLFAVNPAAYATQPDGSARPTILRNLHPMIAQAAQGMSTTQMASLAQSYCF